MHTCMKLVKYNHVKCTQTNGNVPSHPSKDGALYSFRHTWWIPWRKLAEKPQNGLYSVWQSSRNLWGGLEETAGRGVLQLSWLSVLCTQSNEHRERNEIFSTFFFQKIKKTFSLHITACLYWLILRHILWGSILLTCLQTQDKDISCLNKWNKHVGLFSLWLRRYLITLPDRQMDHWSSSKNSFNHCPYTRTQ